MSQQQQNAGTGEMASVGDGAGIPATTPTPTPTRQIHGDHQTMSTSIACGTPPSNAKYMTSSNAGMSTSTSIVVTFSCLDSSSFVLHTLVSLVRITIHN